jgi:hypothetical protein
LFLIELSAEVEDISIGNFNSFIGEVSMMMIMLIFSILRNIFESVALEDKVWSFMEEEKEEI